MDTERIPILPLQASGHDELGGASPVAVNVVADGAGVVTRRPGIAATTRGGTLSAPAVGLHVTRSGALLAFAGELPGDYDVLQVTPTGERNIAGYTGNTRPVLVETEGLVAWADGRRPNMLELPLLTPGPLGASPPRATHLAAIASRLLANDQDSVTHVNYTAPATGGAVAPHQSWNEGATALGTSSFFAAEATPDPVLALAANSNEVYAFKSTVSTAFAPDATSVFVPTTSREIGIAAAHSLVADDSAFAWLDNRRRFVLSDLRQIEVLSEPIQGTIDAMSRVDDCWGFRYHHGAVDALVWVFPTDGRALAYQRGVGWAQWMGNGGSLGLSAFHDVRTTREHLVCLTDGRLGDMQPTAGDDLGTTIPAYVRTGYINHGSDHLKQCHAVRIAMRRGLSTPEAYIGLSWRDGTGPWEGPIRVGTGASGDTEIVVELRGLGVYRRRQWHLEFHGAGALCLAGVEEDFEVLSQ